MINEQCISGKLLLRNYGRDDAHTARNYRNHYKTKTATGLSLYHAKPIS